MEKPRTHLLAVALAACTLLLVITGAVVTTNEERPLYWLGQYHTPIGIAVLAIAAVLAVAVRGTAQRKLVWGALAAIAAESALGYWGDPMSPAVRVAHAMLAQLLFATTVVLALVTSGDWQGGPKHIESPASLNVLARLTPALVLLQVVLGISFRHGVLGVLPHLSGGLIIPIFIVVFAIPVLNRPGLAPVRPYGVAMLVVAGAQVFLGFTLFSMQQMDADPTAMIVVTLAHATTAALTLSATMLLAVQVLRAARPTMGTTVPVAGH